MLRGALMADSVKVDVQAQGKLDWSLPEGFHLHFEGLEGELYVGGVYVRKFMKQPGFALAAPKVGAPLSPMWSPQLHCCSFTKLPESACPAT